jgi:hypothetical protein
MKMKDAGKNNEIYAHIHETKQQSLFMMTISLYFLLNILFPFL